MSDRFKSHIPAIAPAMSEAHEGPTETQVFENAIEHDDREMLGRRMTELVRHWVRPGRRRTLPDESGVAQTGRGVAKRGQTA